MLRAELLDRLEQLNRSRPLSVRRRTSQPLEAQESATVAAQPVPPRRGPARVVNPAETALEKLAPGRQVQNSSGVHYLVRQPLAELWHDAPPELAQGLPMRPPTADSPQGEHPELAALAEGFPRKAMFLDLETCGFAGSAIFLVGVLHWHRGGLVLDQLLARDYSEERPMLASLWQCAAANRVLVTFNGKSFDWPMVHDRSTYHHLGSDPRGGVRGKRRCRSNQTADKQPAMHDLRPDPLHCDLLHHARRRWKHRLPNCKLQTLERYVCRRVRRGDIPGSQIPLEYHDFVRTGDARQLGKILHHNAMDLVTLAHLALRILG